MCFGGGGGGGQQTVVQKNEIPQYLQDFSQENIGVAKGIADRGFPVYGGQRIADPSNLTTGAQNLQNQMSQNYWDRGFNEFQQPINTLLNSMVNNQYGQQVPGAIQSAANASAGTYGQPLPGVQQAGAGSYWQPTPQPGTFGQQASAGSFGQPVPQAQSFGQSINPWSVAPWMSPFIQQALDPQLREISRQGAASGRTIQNQAAGAGAFGDARTGVEMGENTRNTNQLRSDATAQGYQSAYDRAVSAAQNAFGLNAGQFNTEQAAQLQRWGAGAGQFNTEEAARRAAIAQNAQQFNTENAARLASYQAGAGQFNVEDAARRAAAAQNNQYNLAQYQAGAGQFNTEDAARRAATTANAQINALNNAANLDVYKTGAGQFNTERAAQLAAAAGAQNAVLGQQQYGSNLAQQLYAGGTLDEQQRQKSLDLAYQDFINQFEYPQEMLNLRLAAGQGVPYSTTRLTTTPYSATGQAIGSLAALYGLFGRPAGGTGQTAAGALGGIFGGQG